MTLIVFDDDANPPRYSRTGQMPVYPTLPATFVAVVEWGQAVRGQLLARRPCGRHPGGCLMSVTLERCAGEVFVVRAGDAHTHHGDPYEMACTVDCVDGLATVKGLATDKKLTRSVLRELSGLLREQGVHTLRIERIRGDRTTERDWDIS